MTMGNLHTQIIETFNTHLMKDEVIEALTTGRTFERDVILDVIEANLEAEPKTVQHLIINGPRGFGKSFLVRMIQIEANKRAEEGAPLVFILLPEEQHNLIRSPSGLLDYVAHKIEDQHLGTDQSWSKSMFQWPKPDRVEVDWLEAEKNLDTTLERYLGSEKGLAVVVIENFDLLLNTAFKSKREEQLLRKWMTRPHLRFMILATATGSVDLDYNRPLFQAFRSIRLEPWTTQECLDYFNRRRNHVGKPLLTLQEEAKARAVSDFIGGTPRLAQLLAEILDADTDFEKGAPLTVVTIMNHLADRLADYYRNRMSELSPLAQGLLDALIRGGEPCSATELAHRVGADGQHVVARVMKDLQQADMIRGVHAPDSREKLFRVVDRVLVHFYRLRQGHFQTIDSPLATILEFLRAFYSPSERQHQAIRCLDAGHPSEADLFARLAQEDRKDAGYSSFRQEFSYRLSHLLKIAPDAWPENAKVIEKALQYPASVIDNEKKLPPPVTPLEAAIRSVIIAQAYTRMGLLKQAVKAMTDVYRKTKEYPEAAIVIATEISTLSAMEKNDSTEAVKWAKIAGDLTIHSKIPILQINAAICHAWGLRQSGDNKVALSKAAKAANLAKQANYTLEQAEAMVHKAYALFCLADYSKAIDVANHAADLAKSINNLPIQADAMMAMALAHLKLKHYDEAIEATDQSAIHAKNVNQKQKQAAALTTKALILGMQNLHKKAIETATQASDLATEIGNEREKAAACLVIANTLKITGRVTEAFNLLKTVFFQSVANNSTTIASESIFFLLLLAAETPQPEITGLFECWMKAESRLRGADQNKSSFKIPSITFNFFPEFLAAATRVRAWEKLDNFPIKHKDHATEIFNILFIDRCRLIGRAIALVGKTEGRAAGFDAAQGILSRADKFIAPIIPKNKKTIWLASVTGGFAADCHDAGLLRDVAGLLKTSSPFGGPAQARLLESLADFEASGKNRAGILARMDPDVALWVRRIRDIPDQVQVKSRKRRRKK